MRRPLIVTLAFALNRLRMLPDQAAIGVIEGETAKVQARIARQEAARADEAGREELREYLRLKLSA